MTLQDALEIAAKHGLRREILASYRQIKPWWAFWISEGLATRLALEDWDLVDNHGADDV